MATLPSALLALLTEPDQHYPVFRRMYSFLDIESLLALRRTSKTLYSVNKTVINTQWSFNARIGQLFTDPIAFRNLQARTGALVSGRLVEQFFSRTTHSRGSPGVCVLISTPAAHLTDWKMYTRSEGYSFSEIGHSGHSEIRDSGQGLRGNIIWCFLKEPSRDCPPTRIEIASCWSPPLYCLFKTALTTNELQIVSWNKAYSVFPVSTHLDHEAFALEAPDSSMGAELKRLGYTFKNLHWREKQASRGDSMLLSRRRQLGDTHSWIINLDTTGITPSKTPDYVLESSAFQLFPHKDRLTGISRYKMHVEVMEACTLEYQYVYSPLGRWRLQLDPAYETMLESILRRLNEATFMELVTMGVDERPEEFYQAVMADVDKAHTLRGRFKLPEEWRFYDNEMPRLLRELVEYGSSW